MYLSAYTDGNGTYGGWVTAVIVSHGAPNKLQHGSEKFQALGCDIRHGTRLGGLYSIVLHLVWHSQ